MTAPTLGAQLATKLIAQGHATADDQPLIERFAEAEPRQAQRMADIAGQPSRGPKFELVLQNLAAEPFLGAHNDGSPTLGEELNQANSMATLFTPVGSGLTNAEYFLQSNSLVKSLVDLPLVSSTFSKAERARLTDIAGDMIFKGAEEEVVEAWEGNRNGTTDQAAFARDLVTLREAARVMTPDNVATGAAADGLAMAAPQIESQGGQRLLTTLKLVVDRTYDGQVALDDYARDHAKHGPWKQVIGHMPEHTGTFLAMDAQDRLLAKRAAVVAADQAQKGTYGFGKRD